MPNDTTAPIDPTDSILWIGRPDPELAARSARVMVPVGGLFVFTGIAFAIIVAVEISRWFFLLGLPIVALGIVLIDSPRRARSRAARTEYAVTSRWARIRRPKPFGNAVVETRIGPPELSQVEAIDLDDGLGQVIFFAHDPEVGEGVTQVHCRFDGIPEAQRVAEIARKSLLT